MSQHFRDARLKIKRANHHIADLKGKILSLKKSYASSVQPNSETGTQNLVHTLEFSEYADDIALIAGDAIHNLRAALDFAWVSTLKVHIPSANLDRAKLPVYPTREDLIGALNGININPISNTAIFNLIVTDIQPYEAGKYAGIVYTLHKLDITDKHLLLLGLKPLAGIQGIVVEDENGETIRGFGAATEANPPYVIPFPGNFSIKNKGELSFDIVLREPALYDGLEVGESFSKFSQIVLYIIELMENL